jgi:hypothetical protein
MHIGSYTDFVKIVEVERAPLGLPSAGNVRVAVQVALGEFKGGYESVWLEEPHLRDFVEQLAKVENTRTGTVTLKSASPDEFVLTIRSRGPLGRFVGEVSLCRHRYFDSTLWPATVSGGFEIDPTSIPLLLDEFRSLHRPQQ